MNLLDLRYKDFETELAFEGDGVDYHDYLLTIAHPLADAPECPHGARYQYVLSRTNIESLIAGLDMLSAQLKTAMTISNGETK